MTQIATITSKRQLTIPASIFKKAKLHQKQKVLIIEEDGKLIISPFVGLVEKLAGSLEMPKKWKGKTLDQIIERSKHQYFSKPKVNDLR